MRLSNRLKDLFASERGNVLAIGAATLPLLMGSAGFAIDSVQMAMWKRQLQRAADSAAIAGAHALVQGAETGTAVANDVDEHIDYDLEENETPMLAEDPRITSGSYADRSLSTTQDCDTRGGTPCFDRAIQVSLVAERTLPFMSLFTRSATRLTATATAAVVPEGEFCLISLYNGTDTGIRTGGNADLALGCGMTTNARGSSQNPAFRNYGSSTVTATPVAAVGSIGGGADFAAGTTLLPYSSPVDDPFSDVPDPTIPPGETCNTQLKVGKQYTDAAPLVLDAANGNLTCYTSWDITGTVQLEPGTYYVNDGLLDLKGKIIGNDVTIVFMGDNSDFKHNAQGVIDIDAPEDGDYEGIALYRDRNAAWQEFKINGGANTRISGAIYMPSTDVMVNGGSQITSTCLQVVSRKIHFSGGGSIDNDCPDQSVRSIKYNMVRLVG